MLEWGHEAGRQRTEQGRDKREKNDERVGCAWRALLRGAHVAQLMVERHLATDKT